MSSTSSGWTPASGDIVTLRIELPQASRVVSPASATMRSTSPVSGSGMRWNWKHWRVVMWPTRGGA